MTFQETYGNDTWDVVHLRRKTHCYENFNATKKPIALNLVCQGKYREEDLVFIRITTDFKAGWAFTKDSFCCGGSIGNGIIPYSEIVSVRQELGGKDSGIWITPKQPNENIKLRKMSSGEYRVWSESDCLESGYEVLTGYGDHDDMNRIVAYLDIVKSLLDQG